LGNAILFYERTRRLMPRDGDLASNYAYALSFVKEPVSPVQGMWLLRQLHSWVSYFTVDEVTSMLIVLYLLIISVLTVRLWVAIDLKIMIGMLAVAGTLAAVFSVSIVQTVQTYGREAVVVAEEVPAKFEPFDQATTHFTVYEGMKVTVEQSKGEWDKIERVDGKQGWIHHESVEPLTHTVQKRNAVL